MFTVKIGEQTLTLEQKTPILELISIENQKKYIAAKVNNRLRELNYEVYYDCEIELLDLTNSDAVKVYETSLRYLLAMAFRRVYPQYSVRFSYNVSRSIFIQFLNFSGSIDNSIIQNLKKEVDALIEKDISFNRVTMSKEEAIEFYKKEGYYDKIDILKYRPEKIVHLYECDGYLNYMYGYMVPSTGYLKYYVLRQYNPGLILQYPRAELGGLIPAFEEAPTFGKALKKAHQWAIICDAETVAKMNSHVSEETVVDFVNMCETKHNNMLAELGQIIEKDIDNIRLIAIAGPSSSGKTTFSNRLRIELMSRGINPLRISIDDYYLPKNQAPLDENGNPDLEHIEALDIDLFNEHMLKLIQGEEITLPSFNFKTGMREDGPKCKVDSKTPIIIEGIHALNDILTSSIPKHQKFKIYISPQIQINIDNHNPISLTDIRLLRRIVRDKKSRNTSAEKTLEMWNSVRRGEFNWIYPNQEGANYIFNSELTYELCVMKKYALPALQAINNDHPYFIMANRLIKFLKHFKDIDDKFVPCNSLLREFIGGSCFYDV